MNKILTIVIPTYNMEKYLDKCLTSLIVEDELMEQLEVLVINDGSKDCSSEIAHNYEKRYPQTFRVIDKENGNYGSCVNRGLKEANGKYIKILDADDYFNTCEFGGFLELLKSQDVDMILTPFCYVTPSDHVKCVHRYDITPNIQQDWSGVAKHLMSSSLQMHAVTYRLNIFKGLDYHQTEGISYTDQEWIFTPLFQVKSIMYYNHEIYQYLTGREGQTMDPQRLKRDISHNEICVRRIINDYHNKRNNYTLSWSQEHTDYIHYRFQKSVLGIYQRYLLDYRDMPLEGLIIFDDYLCCLSNEYRKMVDETVLKGTSIQYIKEWHKERTKPLPFMIHVVWGLLCTYSRITRKINNVLSQKEI